MSNSPLKNDPRKRAELAGKLVGAVFAATLMSGAVFSGAVLLPATASAVPDSDGDGLEDPYELHQGLDPNNRDTDGDDISDGDEVKRYHTNPLVPNAKPPAATPPPAGTPPPTQTPTKPKDTDGDGSSDDDEINKYRTDPNRKDTDRDGRDDGAEVKNGTNPRVPLI